MEAEYVKKNRNLTLNRVKSIFIPGFLLIFTYILAIQYAFAADLTPPILNSVTVSPVSINDGNTITVTIEAGDEAGESGLKEAVCYLESPGGIQVIK